MRLMVVLMLFMATSCSSLKRWASDAAVEVVNEKLGPVLEKQLDPVELAELQRRAADAGFVDENGEIRYTKLLTSGNGLAVLGLFLVWWLRRRMGRKVGELWKGKADAEPPKPAVSSQPPS